MNVKPNMQKNFFIITLLSVICDILCTDVIRPRGVSLSKASLYNPDINFVCFDGSKTIPFTQVNDDYCDCADASDEPGTSACPRGTFHCTNAGHAPLNIVSSRVNDGICDCCDGSDEYASKNTHCVNNCLELGRTAREEAQRRAELVKAGKQLKAELSQIGIQIKQEKRAKLQELKRNLEEAEKVKTEREIFKKEIEELENAALEKYRKLEEEERQKKQLIEEAKNKQEAIDAFYNFDLNNDGSVSLDELQTKTVFDRNKDGEVTIEEAKYFINNEDAVDLDKFITNCWPNIKPFIMVESGVFKGPTATAHDTQERSTEVLDQYGTEDVENEGAEEEEGEEAEEEEEAPAPQEEPQEEMLHIPYDDETQHLVNKATDARNICAQAEKSVRDLESEIKNIQEFLEKDFGPDEEFSTLQGQCFEYQDVEYIYKLCPFEKAIQQAVSGGSETVLGTWGRWSGPQQDIYQTMMYERGQSCWNGPQRSCEVNVLCGSENKLISVSEPNRCEYLFELNTPAACRDLLQEDSGNIEDVHDEL